MQNLGRNFLIGCIMGTGNVILTIQHGLSTAFAVTLIVVGGIVIARVSEDEQK